MAEKRPQIADDNEFLKQQQLNNKSRQGFHPPGRGGPLGQQMVREKPKNIGQTIKRLINYIGRSKYYVMALLGIMLVTTLLNLTAPALQGSAIDSIVGADANLLFRTLAMMICVYLTSSILNYFQAILAAKLSQSTVFTMRNDFFRKLVYLPIKYIDTHQHGDLMSRMTNDIENVSNTISQSISSLVSGIITLIGSLAMMLYYNWQLTLVAFITIPITVFSTTFLSKFMRKFFIKQQRLLGELNGHIEETVSGYKTIMAYSHEKKSINEFNEISKELRKTGIKANVISGLMGPMMNVINNIGFLLIAVFGGVFALNGAITIGVIQSFILYSRQFTRPINEIANQYASILTAISGAERVFSVMDEGVESDEKNKDIDISKVKGNLSFSDVNFSYKEGEPVLRNFNLEVKSGQRIAIVGRTGSGKTTIVNLLTRFYDISDGSIKLDGTDIREISKDTLRKSIAIVLQDTVLFSETIKKNIRYGNLNSDDDQICNAAKTANADIFIDRLLDGYETQLSESGHNISQGQRQLLAISRAVLADPKILILDEATSSVDTRTEMQIQSAMLKLMENRTSLIIAHRLSTIRDADVIIVLENGHIVESGNHENLLEQHGVYYNLYQTQFSGVAT